MAALTTLDRAYKVDEAINSPGKLVIIRFEAEDKKEYCEKVDNWLKKEVIEPNSNDVAAYAVAKKDVPELVARYKLYADVTLIFFLDYVQVERLNLNTGADADLGNHKAKIEGVVGMKKNKKDPAATADGNQSSSAPPPTRASYRVRRYYRRYGINNF